MLLEDSESKVGVPYLVDCDEEGNKCVLDIITITDFKTSSEGKVQVYITGSLQGDERLGPQIAFYLIEYLVSNFKRDVFITHLLQTREIIITPMPNAYGYAKDTRKELTFNLDSNNTVARDPIRDFPYNNTESACLNTVAARTLYRLFVDNLFVTAITFHGGYKTAIGYPWGSFNHGTQTSAGVYIGLKSPDFKAFEVLGQAMKESAGGEIPFTDSSEMIEEYELGNIIETIFPASGSFTDWAYGGGWDIEDPYATQATCDPLTQPPLDEDFFTRTVTENVRTAIFRVETDPS